MTISAAEQLLLELINRARLDPAAESARLGVALNRDLPAGTIGTTPQQVLAPNQDLEQAAQAHSTWMLQANVFSHTGEGGSDPGDRMAAAGYSFTGAWMWGENLAWSGSTASINLNQAITTHYVGLFESAHHRENTLNGDFREIGLAQVSGQFDVSGSTYNASMLTETFATSGTALFLTGVSFQDNNSDQFYGIGEGLGGITISAGGQSETTASAGGYALSHSANADLAVTLSRGGSQLAQLAVDLTGGNAKLDLIESASGGSYTLALSTSARLISGVADARLLGLAALDLQGDGDNNRLTGNAGANLIYGGGGNDHLFGGAGDDLLSDGSGSDSLTGGSGNDLFVLSADGVADTIADYTDGQDQIDLSAWSGLWQFSQLAISQGSSSTTLSFGSETLVLIAGGGGAVAASALSAGDFLLSTEPPPPPEPTAGPGALVGGSGADTIEGTGGADALFGYGGNDLLTGQGGNDQLVGGSGRDYLDGGTGADQMYGGLGNDIYLIDNVDDQVLGEQAYSQGGGIDTVMSWISLTLPQNVEILRLEGGADLNGYGNGNPEVLVGNTGANTLSGGWGDDRIVAKSGNDIIIGGGGSDELVGDAGADSFVYTTPSDSRPGPAGRDFINGFDRGADNIDLSAIDADPFRAGDQAFQFLGATGFHGNGADSAGELRYASYGGNWTIIEADLNGDGVADMQIFVNLTNYMTGSDFVL